LQVLQDRTNILTVAIEDVFQTHNTSAVVRSCDIFGVQEAHLIEFYMFVYMFIAVFIAYS
jgi:tRNA (guanosine-2'-O-)-methyltransferase